MNSRPSEDRAGVRVTKNGPYKKKKESEELLRKLRGHFFVGWQLNRSTGGDRRPQTDSRIDPWVKNTRAQQFTAQRCPKGEGKQSQKVRTPFN